MCCRGIKSFSQTPPSHLSISDLEDPAVSCVEVQKGLSSQASIITSVNCVNEAAAAVAVCSKLIIKQPWAATVSLSLFFLKKKRKKCGCGRSLPKSRSVSLQKEMRIKQHLPGKPCSFTAASKYESRLTCALLKTSTKKGKKQNKNIREKLTISVN